MYSITDGKLDQTNQFVIQTKKKSDITTSINHASSGKRIGDNGAHQFLVDMAVKLLVQKSKSANMDLVIIWNPCLPLNFKGGILLCGPHRVGKILLAKVVASEVGINFFSISALSWSRYMLVLVHCVYEHFTKKQRKMEMKMKSRMLTFC